MDDETIICQNCGSVIEQEDFDRMGVDEYCEDCPEMCCDPRSKTFGCECENEDD